MRERWGMGPHRTEVTRPPRQLPLSIKPRTSESSGRDCRGLRGDSSTASLGVLPVGPVQQWGRGWRAVGALPSAPYSFELVWSLGDEITFERKQKPCCQAVRPSKNIRDKAHHLLKPSKDLPKAVQGVSLLWSGAPSSRSVPPFPPGPLTLLWV